MVYGYARVSTVGQAIGGNSLESQEQQLRAAGAEKIYSDKFTGATMERPEFEKMKSQLRQGDTVIVTKLDRLARSVSQASGLIEELISDGVKINVLNIGMLSQDSVNVLMRNILLAFAQFERDMIVQRTQEGKAIARQNPNYREGRPKKYPYTQLNHAMDLLQTNSYTQVASMTGISRSTLAREAKKRKEIAAEKAAMELSRKNNPNATIEEMDLSQRAYLCLQKANIHTARDIMAMSMDDFNAIPHLGRKCTEEILIRLKEMGLSYPNKVEEKRIIR